MTTSAVAVASMKAVTAVTTGKLVQTYLCS